MIHSSKVTIATQDVTDKFSAKISALGLKEKEHEVEAQAQVLGLPYINLQGFPISQDALEIIPEDDARRLNLVPILASKGEIRLGTTNPQQPELTEYLAKLKAQRNGHYELYFLSPHSLNIALKLYAGVPKVRLITSGVSITEADLKKYEGVATDFTKINQLLTKANLTELTAIIIAGALGARASDIHVEAGEYLVTVRYRIDGILHTAAEVAKEKWSQIISRLKLVAKLKLNVNSEPQDGRFTISLTNDKVDVRVSTIPTAWGESVVMRLLKSSAASLEFEKLGLRGKAYEDLKREVERPNGMIVTTGPTGSGKTTTLYAALAKIAEARKDRKIITVEDPVEYEMHGISQIQMHNQISLPEFGEVAQERSFAKEPGRPVHPFDPEDLIIGDADQAEERETEPCRKRADDDSDNPFLIQNAAYVKQWCYDSAGNPGFLKFME